MKRGLGLACAAGLAAWAAPGIGQELELLIDQNLRTRGLTLQELQLERAPVEAPATGVAPDELEITTPARVWVHVREPEATPVAETLAELLSGSVAVGTVDRPIEMMPVQVVDDGPRQSQVRLFREVDRETAESIAEQLIAQLPDITVVDFTAAYAEASWIEPGHIEIRLAPNAAE